MWWASRKVYNIPINNHAVLLCITQTIKWSKYNSCLQEFYNIKLSLVTRKIRDPSLYRISYRAVCKKHLLHRHLLEKINQTKMFVIIAVIPADCTKIDICHANRRIFSLYLNHLTAVTVYFCRGRIAFHIRNVYTYNIL